MVASIEPRADEAETRNNSKQKHLKVVDDKIKVLMVDQSPRWEFKYLMQQMLRDRRVDLKVFLVDGDPGVSKGENTPYLPEFPKSKGDLNDKYDVLIFGDVDPKTGTLAFPYWFDPAAFRPPAADRPAAPPPPDRWWWSCRTCRSPR